ncbi:MAG TPA: TIGR03667 family PPOX class F420-dependent oxidoreductase [Ktedonobacteraceae bacterium]|nr:TIGR03667 family PPOX class F420-dependent oxidoreductase [Ktedonobacteraceae bacterium]
MTFQLPDPSTPFGERVARRLRDERLIWLTIVDMKGTPQPTPVWFLWDENTATFLIYSRSDAKRLEHLKQNSRVALNFDGNGKGGDIIVFTGQAQVSSDDSPADQLPAYVEKYRDYIARTYKTPENFASIYSVALRVRPLVVRGH